MNEKRTCYNTSHTSGGAVYGFGVIGAAIYFIIQASGFWGVAIGILKAIVWPAILVFEALRQLGA